MSGLISLKITIENDANYLLFGDRICCDVDALESFCRNRYRDLQKNVDDFLYYWIDEDGDAIRITTDEDYQSFLQAMTNAKARVYVVAKNTPLVEPIAKVEYAGPTEHDHTLKQNDATGDAIASRPVHLHVTCDVCDEKIVGHRYKCLTCHDYDLCMGCEAKYRHKDHLMLRIPKPAMIYSSQSTVSRMLDRLRVYSARINSNMEKDLGLEADSNVPAGTPSAEANDSKRSYRCGYRSKYSDERRTNETSKTSRGGKSCGNDRKQHGSVADETSGERSSKDNKEKPSVPTASDYMQRCREMMYMYLNSDAGLDSTVKTAPWYSNDHVAVANVAAATAAAAAARATALANNAMKANVAMQNSQSVPASETAQSCQGVEQLLSQTEAPKQQKSGTAEQQPSGGPPAAPLIPLPFLPFVNLTWPTQEKLLVASENVSKLLDPLGLSFEIRHKSSSSPSASPGCAKARGGEDDGAVPSTSASGIEPTSSIPTTSTVEPSVQQEQVKSVETKVSPAVPEKTPNNITQSPIAPVCGESKENGAKTQKASLEPKAEKNTISGTLESDSACEKKPEAVAENEVDDDDDSQNTSSASLLTDDDQDLMEVVENEEKASGGSSKPSVPKEKAWTLIDLPEEHDEERVANAPLDAIAKLIGRDLSSPDKEQSQPTRMTVSSEKKKDKTAEEKQKKPSDIGAVLKAAVDRHYEYEILRRMSATEQKEKLNRREIVDTQQPAKDAKPLSTSPPNSGPSSSLSSGSGSDSRSGSKSSRKSSSAQQKDSTIYSHRPHVNHAIHTMMTMGFSNHNGWLTQLLESLNGDIPKALDLLLQHRH